MSETVRIGVLLPTREMAMAGSFAARPLLDFARTAEELGFDSVWAGDSLLARPRLDPFVVLAAAAAVTSRVTIGTAALTAALRHPLIGANMAASVDHAAGGNRLVLGLGAGFPVPESEDEHTSVGVPFAGRAGRLDELVRLWRAAWGSREPGAATAFAGKSWQQEGLDRLVPTATPGGPKLWLAGSDTPRVLARAAELYDGWLPFLPDHVAYRTAWRTLAGLAAEASRTVTPGLYVTLNLQQDRTAAHTELEDYVRGYYGRSLEMVSSIQAYGYGGPAECVDYLGNYIEAGARHIVIRIGSLNPLPHLEQIATHLLPALRGRLGQRPLEGVPA